MTITSKYKAYLKSDKWEALRNEVLERDDYTCQECGERAWQVHHKTYANIFNEPLSDLLAVCALCHRKIHGIENKPKKHIIYRGTRYAGKIFARMAKVIR